MSASRTRKRNVKLVEPQKECPNCDGKGYEVWENDRDGYDHTPCEECNESGVNPAWEQWNETQENKAGSQ